MITHSPRYTLHEQLRQGDLATVFRGIDNTTGMPAFVALLTDVAATDRITLAALRSELPLLQNADPALITVLDYNLSTPPLYVMVEYMSGVSLRQLVDSAGKGLQPSEALAYCAEAARCVAAIHSRGAVHGAVHIDDFVLRGMNMVCISAWVAELFGADLFATTNIHSTREPLDKHIYQPPELAAHMGQQPSAAGDIYGLGILLYHLLTGVPPGVAPGSPELAAWLRGGQSPPLDETIADATLRSRLQKFIQVSTSRDPMRRWPDLKTFITGLEQINPSGTMSMPRIVTTPRAMAPTPPPLPPSAPSTVPAPAPAPHQMDGFAATSSSAVDNMPNISAPMLAPQPQEIDTIFDMLEPQPQSQPQSTPQTETGPLPRSVGQYPTVVQYGGTGSSPQATAPTSPPPPAQPPRAAPLMSTPATPSQQPQPAQVPTQAPQPMQPPMQAQTLMNPQPAPQPPAQAQQSYGYGYGYSPPQPQTPQPPQPQPQPPQPQPSQSQSQPRTAYLVSLLTGTVYPVKAARVSLGVARTTNYFPDVNLAMEPPAQAQFVSQHHLDLLYDRGQWYAQPSATARNPTFLNGSQLPPGSFQPIYEGMVLEIPALPLRFSFSIT